MLEKDLVKFSEIMTGLSEIYGKDMSSFMLDIYFQALNDFDIVSVERAFSAHVRNPDNGQFFPKPADIVKLISGTSRDAGYVAWTKVDKTVRMVGSWQSVVFDDPIIHSVISDMGGWILLGEKTEKEWVFVSKEFMERYQAHKSKQDSTGNYPQKLIGKHEADNSRGGFEIVPPVLIGNPTEAKKVLLGGSGKNRLQIERLDIKGFYYETQTDSG